MQTEIVDWVDIVAIDVWATRDEVDAMEPSPCRTIGTVIRETEQFVVLAGTVPGDDCAADTVSYGSVWCIPIGCIVKRTKLPVNPESAP